MEITAISWVGTRTAEYDGMVSCLQNVFGLKSSADEEGFAVFELPNGDKIEVFGEEDEDHPFFTTGPVVGFRVADVSAAQAKMEAAGIEFLGRPASSSNGFAWSHFRAPDGNVYEIMSGPEPDAG